MSALRLVIIILWPMCMLCCAHPSTGVDGDQGQAQATTAATDAGEVSAQDLVRAKSAFAQGRELVSQGKHSDAVVEFERAVLLAPRWSLAHLELAMCRMVIDDTPSKILHNLERALALTPSNPRAHYGLGLYHESYGSQDDALRSYRSALELRPAYPDALYRLALLEESRGDENAALLAYEHVHSLDPTNVGASLGAIRCAQKLNKLKLAEALLLELVRHHPDNLVYKQQLADLWRRRGATKKARKLERYIERQRAEQERELRPLKPSRR